MTILESHYLRHEVYNNIRAAKESTSGPGTDDSRCSTRDFLATVLGCAALAAFFFFLVTDRSPLETLFGFTLLGRGDIVFVSPPGLIATLALCAAVSLLCLLVLSILFNALWAAIRAFARSVADDLSPPGGDTEG